jgi:hypothetical protein
VQRVCEVRGGVSAYLRNPDMLTTAEARRCPFCGGGHVLGLHGWYFRQVILPAGEGCRRISVRRLRCRVTGRTVSLLPAFCIPRRQHGPGVLGLFLVHLFLRGMTLLGSLREARGEAPSHAVAQSLRDGFRRRSMRICEYLSGLDGCPVRADRLPGVVERLRAGCRQIRRAFTAHGLALHAASGVGLA